MKTLATTIISFIAIAAVTTAANAGSGARNGTHPDGQGGAVCKGIGSCLVLELDCKGTYTDATDKNGTVYGHCTQVNKRSSGLKTKS